MVVISTAVAVGLRSKTAKERKTCRAVYSGTCTSGQVIPPTRPPSWCMFNPTSEKHLSLNTALMKVIHFNGASFQTPVIKACGALDWEVVETARVPVSANKQSCCKTDGHLSTIIHFTVGRLAVMERSRNLNHVREMKTTFS